jgi:hypothetical protein
MTTFRPETEIKLKIYISNNLASSALIYDSDILTWVTSFMLWPLRFHTKRVLCTRCVWDRVGLWIDPCMTVTKRGIAAPILRSGYWCCSLAPFRVLDAEKTWPGKMVLSNLSLSMGPKLRFLTSRNMVISNGIIRNSSMHSFRIARQQRWQQ